MGSVGVRNKFLILGRLVAVQSRNSGSWNTAAGEARQADDPQWVDFCQYSSTQEWLQWSRCGPGCKRNFMSGYGLERPFMLMGNCSFFVFYNQELLILSPFLLSKMKFLIVTIILLTGILLIICKRVISSRN